MQETVRARPTRILSSIAPPETYLYHYTKPTTLCRILQSGSLRLGPYAETNDPAENQRWHFGMGGVVTPERERNDSYWRDNEAADRLTRQRAKLACLTMERSHVPDSGHGFFHRGWARARMWEQYAQGHTGACLVFRKRELDAAVQQALPPTAGFYAGQVQYEDRRLISTLSWTRIDRVGMEETVRQYLRQHWQERFFTKNLDWSSEVEYRYVALYDGEPLLVPIADALAAIVLGGRYPLADLEGLRSRLSGAGLDDVPVGSCHWWNGAPHLGRPEGWARDERL